MVKKKPISGHSFPITFWKRVALMKNSDNLDQLYLEGKLLARQRVVGIERNGFVGKIHNHDDSLLSVGKSDLQLLADFEFHIRWKPVAADFSYKLDTVLTVSVIRLEPECTPQYMRISSTDQRSNLSA